MRAEILQGDAVTMLATLRSGSVNCCVTSPPYYSLRDYGTASWEGGEAECDHEITNAIRTAWANDVSGPNGRKKNTEAGHRKPKETGGSCGKCGAIRVDNQLGLEDTLDCLGWATGDRCGACFICHIVDVFREVRRVLRDDGTAWVNMGDSYCCAANGRSAKDTKAAGKDDRTFRDKPTVGYGRGLKPKDLCMQPARVAMALQYDGWYLRSDIIWAKSNAMPESVTDRPAKSHEYIFLLAKSTRYAYDAKAIKEDCSESTHARISQNLAAQVGSFRANGGNKTNGPMKAVVAGSTRKIAEAGSGIANNRSYKSARALRVETRNKRTVWHVPSRGYPDAHFATFPPDLIKPCILAGCPEGGVVLDPFAGSGTTLYVANSLCRHAVGIELNPEYVRLIEKRLAQGFMDWTQQPEPLTADTTPTPAPPPGLFDGDGEAVG